MTAREQGFTLLELLVVMALIGIVAAMAGQSFLGAVRTNQLRDASAQLSADFEQVRSSTFRYNRNATLRITGADTYELTTNGVKTTRNLPNGVTVTPINASVTYNAPYSLLSTPPVTLELRRAGHPKVFTLWTVGVTGKVLLDAK
ncbi:pili assembly chaperone [Deinococcus indicus]|uniref:pilus assembly FimT family protein n=1 Tax=Deinococcus indicus TaxID=223556 RepID=UPI00174B4CD0|nr:prepilin-type N-terminal cleavage/methylation domain-containing protein [Deinococcus indicus]GHG41249.1 pili assembly chaperone [Deinococcus indicus]